jgi:hypothetical protein
MINHKFQYKNKDLTIDFNWEESVIPCKKVRIKIGNKEVIISREEFSTLMAVFADDQQLEDMFQTQKADFVSIERMLRIKTHKDLKAEESLIFPYTYWIPRVEYDKLKEEGEMVKLVENSKKELINYIADNEAGKQVKDMMLNGRFINPNTKNIMEEETKVETPVEETPEVTPEATPEVAE